MPRCSSPSRCWAPACSATPAPGIWIAGTMQVLDVRHFELFLEAYWDRTLENEDLGDHFVDEEVAAAAYAIFNFKRITSPSAACVLNTQSWIRKREDLQPMAHGTTYADAVNSNLKPTRVRTCAEASIPRSRLEPLSAVAVLT
uniref:Uncharacterized protein n=1 Tax=Arundo donax TaxID=35708 RepID=A0A0A9GCX1_ARUDO